MKKGFCENCDKLVNYFAKETNEQVEIHGRMYNYKRIIAYCKNCNEEVTVNEIEDENLKRIDEAYRNAENIIKVDEIKEILNKYKIGKKPLAKLLCWGEVTLIRYINGDIPTKIYSDELYHILRDVNYFQMLLEANKERITSKAYKSCQNAIFNLKHYEFESPRDIDLIAEYIIKTCQEITPLALQKILYYSQAFYMVFFGEVLFKDNCEAWVHGPVYTKIYNKYKEYGSSNINIDVIDDVDEIIDEEKKELVDVIIKCFGYYSGKALEKMTHYEAPWIKSRKGLSYAEKSNNIILKEDMMEYFEKVKEKYNMLNLLDVKKYSEELFNNVIGIY